MVRELMRKRVWFAEPLLSSATQEVRRLIVLARQWAERLDTPVWGWMSDKQDAFVTAIAAEFPKTPHRGHAAKDQGHKARQRGEGDQHGQSPLQRRDREKSCR